MRLHVRFEIEKIVNRMSESLFVTEIAFGRLYRRMSQEELNLLNLAAVTVTQLRTHSPQVVRRNMEEACSFTASLDHVPNDILRNASAPKLSRAGHSPKDSPFTYASRCDPPIQRGFGPLRNGHGADVAALAEQVHDGPVTLADLNLVEPQTD